MKRLLNEFHRAVRARDFFPPGSSVLIALSGGPDSVCLALLINAVRASFKLRVAAAYVDHGLRAQARADGTWVKRFCAEHGIPLHIARARVRERAAKASESIEEAARQARYEALNRIALRNGCSIIATGHTADDQAETVLMRLASGSGLWGLSGIPASRIQGGVRLVRPLLGLSKQEILAGLKRAGVRYRADRSNRSPRYLRNRIRHEALPLLTDRINPRVREHLSDLADDAGRWRAWAEAEAFDFIRRHGRRRGSQLSFGAAAFLKAAEPLRVPVCVKALGILSGREQHLRREHIRQFEALLQGGGSGTLRLAHGASVSVSGSGQGRRIVWRSSLVR